MTSLGEAAADLGLPVFPCLVTGAPLTKRGFYDASTNPDVIFKAFRSDKAVRVGIPTGDASGWDALDVDPRHNGDVWERENRHRLPDTRIHQTPRGGRHYIFRHVHGVGCSIGKIAPGVDVRGTGGYICGPPSPEYTVINDVEPAEWPDWLLELVVRIPEEKPRPIYATPPQPASTKRVEGLVASVLRKVSQAPEGQKHFALRNYALYLGGLAHLTGLSDTDLVRRLMDALPATVQDHRNAQRTAEWGVKEGRSKPVDLPPDGPHWKPTKPAYTNGYANGHDLDDPDKPDISGQDENVRSDAKKLNALPLLWFSEIEPVTDLRDFVQGLLMEQSSVVVYGRSNAGKTFWATDLALHVAAGLTWAGRRVERGGVIYCVLEGGAGFRNRVSAWKMKHALDDSEIPFAAIPSGMNLLDPDADTSRLIDAIKTAASKFDIPVKLVVIDTLARAMAGGNENAPDDMGALVLNIDRIRSETGSAVLSIHHTGKDEAKGARGHSSLQAAVDTEIEVVAEDGSDIKTATLVKQREGAKGAVFEFSLEIVQLGENRYLEPVTTCVVVHGEQQEAETATIRRRLSGHTKRAYEVLVALLGASGETGYAATPLGSISVSDKWWRERFYDGAMPGAADETKQKAFRRASDALVELRRVGMGGGRVWLPEQRSSQNKAGHSGQYENA